MNDKESLQVVDTTHVLTTDELKELKRLAAMSKGVKFVFAILMAGVSFVGIDQLITLLNKGH